MAARDRADGADRADPAIGNRAAAADVTEALETKGYFCQPDHSWEKGGGENLSGLVRQYYPKGMDFSSITEQHLMKTERELNQRPRKTLDYLSTSDLEQNIVA